SRAGAGGSCERRCCRVRAHVAGYVEQGGRSASLGGDDPGYARPARPQDSTPMPPSGDAQPLRPLLPSADEANATVGKDRNGCPRARPGMARKLRVVAAGATRAAGRGTLCRSGRALAGAGVSALGGPAWYEIRVAGVLDGRWAA